MGIDRLFERIYEVCVYIGFPKSDLGTLIQNEIILLLKPWWRLGYPVTWNTSLYPGPGRMTQAEVIDKCRKGESPGCFVRLPQ